MANVKLVLRDDRGLVTRIVEAADATDPLVAHVEELERANAALRAQLSEAETRRAVEINGLHAEQRADLEEREQTHAVTCDLLGSFLRASDTAHDRVRSLRVALDAEAQRANAEAARARVLERALVRVQSEARHLRESLDDAEARLDEVARRNRQNRPKKLDENERAIYAFAASLYR